MKRVLAAVDGSPAADQAVDIAIDIAKGTGTPLVLVHVSEASRLSRQDYPEFVARIEEQHRREAQAILGAARRRGSRRPRQSGTGRGRSRTARERFRPTDPHLQGAGPRRALKRRQTESRRASGAVVSRSKRAVKWRSIASCSTMR